MLIACKRDIKVHIARWLKWLCFDVLWKGVVEVLAGYWPVGLRFSCFQLLEGNSEILLQITSRPFHSEFFQLHCSVIALPFHSVLLTNYPTIPLYIIHQLPCHSTSYYSLITLPVQWIIFNIYLPFHCILFTNYPTSPLDNIRYLPTVPLYVIH